MKRVVTALAISGLIVGAGVLAAPSASARALNDAIYVNEGTYPSQSACEDEANYQNSRDGGEEAWFCDGDTLYVHQS